MVDSHASGRLGRRSSKCISPTSSERSDCSAAQLSPCASAGGRSPGALEYACVVEEGEEAFSDSNARASSQPVASDSDVHKGKETEVPSLIVQIRRSCLALGTYVALSILTIFWTKHLIGGKVPTPLFLSWVQQATGLILHSVVAAAVALTCRKNSTVGRALTMAVPMVRIRPKVMLRVLPLSVCFVGMIGFSNLCLQRVQVSVYQVARSLTLVFSLLLSVFWLKQKVGKGEAFSCLLVALGFALMTAVGSDPASLSGYIMGALASLFQATYTVQMKATLNSFQGQAETLIPSSLKEQSTYQPIVSNSPDSRMGSSSAATGADSRLEERVSGRSDSTVVNVPSSDTSTLVPDDPQDDELRLEDEIFTGQGKSVKVRGYLSAPGLDVIESSDLQSASVQISPIDLEERIRAMEFEEDENRGATNQETGSGSSSSRPRVEPVCMFYNMLNALCLFPIFILISDEPQVLWKLVEEGSVLNSTMLAQVVGLGRFRTSLLDAPHH